MDTFESKLRKEFQEASATIKNNQNSDNKNSDFKTVNSEGEGDNIDVNKHGDNEVENLKGVHNNGHLFQAYVNVEDDSKRTHRQKRNVKVSFLKIN